MAILYLRKKRKYEKVNSINYAFASYFYDRSETKKCGRGS